MPRSGSILLTAYCLCFLCVNHWMSRIVTSIG